MERECSVCLNVGYLTKQRSVHPLIQTGYAVEFGSDAMLAQGMCTR